MAMPISNTHLRVPRGFGAILEGLTREILRDQPKDIPEYAANYFEALLKQRDESGTDPSEWAAKLEDRYYNNHSFRTHDLASKTTVSIKNSQDFTSEDYVGHSQEDVSLATTTTKDSDYANLTKSTHEKESLTITHQESNNGPPVANEDSAASTQADRSPDEKITSTDSNHTISHSDSETHDLQLLSEAANIDVCAQESESEDEQQLTDREEDEPMNVNVEEKTEDEVLVMDDAEQENEPSLESPVSQLETTEHPVQEEETNNDASEAVASTEDPVDSNTDKSLVEISFEDVPESQQTMNNENEQSVNVETVENENDKKPSPQEGELEVERQEATEDDKEANYLKDFDDNREESVDIKDTEHQSTNEADNIEDENIASREDKSSQKDNSEKYDNPDFTEGTSLIGDDTNEIKTEDYLQIEQQKINAQDSESDLSQLTHSNMKTLEEQGDDLEEEHEEEKQPEDNLEKYITTSQKLDLEEEEDELMEKVKLDSEVQEGLSTCEQDSINPDLEERGDQVDTGLQEKQHVTLDPEGETDDQQEECSRPQEEEDIMDIPLDDPEANRAAAKIQAGFRGHMTRKKMKPEDKTEGEERQEDRGQ